ncbi:hypothetical protein [Aureibacter tunicatorum]|uniref:Uncharacterized protein n=1 Tax=Aureibacter tunicatorum TaxID=866807 RepID=A0AAE4BSC6_9BACT|nr:hypothetical protein [Aureibacter tunicatorum]MDR6239621.1 hypothetical protein [Aureibacter tunicatorum]BDD04098.1 hypothetical protein AUTU_15810 [Aureibacter tunicatorum]
MYQTEGGKNTRYKNNIDFGGAGISNKFPPTIQCMLSAEQFDEIVHRPPSRPNTPQDSPQAQRRSPLEESQREDLTASTMSQIVERIELDGENDEIAKTVIEVIKTYDYLTGESLRFRRVDDGGERLLKSLHERLVCLHRLEQLAFKWNRHNPIPRQALRDPELMPQLEAYGLLLDYVQKDRADITQILIENKWPFCPPYKYGLFIDQDGRDHLEMLNPRTYATNPYEGIARPDLLPEIDGLGNDDDLTVNYKKTLVLSWIGQLFASETGNLLIRRLADMSHRSGKRLTLNLMMELLDDSPDFEKIGSHYYVGSSWEPSTFMAETPNPARRQDPTYTFYPPYILLGKIMADYFYHKSVCFCRVRRKKRLIREAQERLADEFRVPNHGPRKFHRRKDNSFLGFSLFDDHNHLEIPRHYRNYEDHSRFFHDREVFHTVERYIPSVSKAEKKVAARERQRLQQTQVMAVDDDMILIPTVNAVEEIMRQEPQFVYKPPTEELTNSSTSSTSEQHRTREHQLEASSSQHVVSSSEITVEPAASTTHPEIIVTAPSEAIPNELQKSVHVEVEPKKCGTEVQVEVVFEAVPDQPVEQSLEEPRTPAESIHSSTPPLEESGRHRSLAFNESTAEEVFTRRDRSYSISIESQEPRPKTPPTAEIEQVQSHASSSHSEELWPIPESNLRNGVEMPEKGIFPETDAIYDKFMPNWTFDPEDIDYETMQPFGIPGLFSTVFSCSDKFGVEYVIKIPVKVDSKPDKWAVGIEKEAFASNFIKMVGVHVSAPSSMVLTKNSDELEEFTGRLGACQHFHIEDEYNKSLDEDEAPLSVRDEFFEALQIARDNDEENYCIIIMEKKSGMAATHVRKVFPKDDNKFASVCKGIVGNKKVQLSIGESLIYDLLLGSHDRYWRWKTFNSGNMLYNVELDFSKSATKVHTWMPDIKTTEEQVHANLIDQTLGGYGQFILVNSIHDREVVDDFQESHQKFHTAYDNIARFEDDPEGFMRQCHQVGIQLRKILKTFVEGFLSPTYDGKLHLTRRYHSDQVMTRAVDLGAMTALVNLRDRRDDLRKMRNAHLAHFPHESQIFFETWDMIVKLMDTFDREQIQRKMDGQSNLLFRQQFSRPAPSSTQARLPYHT